MTRKLDKGIATSVVQVTGPDHAVVNVFLNICQRFDVILQNKGMRGFQNFRDANLIFTRAGFNLFLMSGVVALKTTSFAQRRDDLDRLLLKTILNIANSEIFFIDECRLRDV